MIGRRLMTIDSWERDMTEREKERESELNASIEALRTAWKQSERAKAELERENAILRQELERRPFARGAYGRLEFAPVAEEVTA